jgi:putative membrane protein
MNRGVLLFLLGALTLGSACSRQDASDSAGASSGETAATGSEAGGDTGASQDMGTTGDMGATGAGDTTGTTGTAGGTQGANADQSFFEGAAEGGMAEVETGKLAQSKGSSREVKRFGEMMVTDHTKANDRLMKIAADHGITLPTALNAEHQAMRTKLEGLSGAAFDKEYIQGQIRDHEATIALFKAEIDGGQNADAKAFATETLPTVEAHLKRAKEIAAKVGASDAG